jgi:hypothetical protein
MGCGVSKKTQQRPKRRRLALFGTLAAGALLVGGALAQAENVDGAEVNSRAPVVAPAGTAVSAAPVAAPVSTTKSEAKAAPIVGETKAKATKTKLAAPAGTTTSTANGTESAPPDVGDAGVAAAKPHDSTADVAGDTDDSTEDLKPFVGRLVVPAPLPPPAPAPTALGSTDPNQVEPAAPPPPPPSIGVSYLNRAVFLLANDGSKTAKERAKRLSDALKAAIEADAKASPDAPNVELVMQPPNAMELRVRGHVVGTLTDKDAIAARQPDLATYARALDEGLELFVADQRRKIALQAVAMRVAIALLVSIIGLFMLRLAQTLFQRADEYIDEHSGAIRPFRILGVPVIGVEGLNAAITFTVAIGRIATLLGIVVVTIAVALAQFETTRPWIAVAIRWSTARVLSGIEELVLILPRLLIAIVLVLVGSAAVRVARVLFDDTTTTATPWGTVSRRRAAVLRVLIPIGISLLIVPLVVAAVFGHFHTPLEVLIIALVLGASFGLAPLVASGAMGLAATWHGVLLSGDHIRIGNKRGRVVRTNPFWVELEDENGLRKDVPLLALVNRSVTHYLEPAPQRLRVKIKRPTDIPAALQTLQALVKTVCVKHAVECSAFDAEHAEFLIDVWAEPQEAAELVRRLAEPNVEHPVLELTRLQYPDMVRDPG